MEKLQAAAGDKWRQERPDKPTNTGSDKVMAMQKKLKAAGFDLGTFGAAGDGIDGKWGNKTQAAYDAYKADKNLKRAEQPDAASRERERIAAQANAAQAPAGTNVNKIDVDTLQQDYPRTAVVTAADPRAAAALASKPAAAVAAASEPALNTNSVPYATDAKATADRDRVGAAAKAAAALIKEELQDMLRLSGLRGK